MRADVCLFRLGLAESRTLARRLIEDGRVQLNGRTIRKASEDIPEDARGLLVAPSPVSRYVSRGGLKLEAALRAFRIQTAGAVVADIGASTGGFTDCLLQRGAARVYAVDAGHGQLHPRLAADPRVRAAEGLNARFLTRADLVRLERAAPDPDEVFDGRTDGCVMDVSFISQTLILPAVAGVVRGGGFLLSLIKPQFELTARDVGRNGVVRSGRAREAARERVLRAAAELGFDPAGVIPSPLAGGAGNREYLAYFVRRGDPPPAEKERA